MLDEQVNKTCKVSGMHHALGSGVHHVLEYCNIVRQSIKSKFEVNDGVIRNAECRITAG